MAYKEIYTKPDGGIPDSDIASANTWNNKVPSTRKVNGKALSSDIALTASDVGALPTSGGSLTGNLTVGSSNIGTNGYVEGTWLRTTKATESAGDFATINGGWIYKRAPANVLGDIGGQAKITANGILKGDGTGNVTAADETEVELVDITPELIGAQPKIIANGFLTSDGEGNVGAEQPVMTVEVWQRGAPTPGEKPGEYIYDFGSNYNYAQIIDAQRRGYMVVVYYAGNIFYYTGENSNDGLIFSKIGKRYSTCSYDRLRCTSDDKWHQESNTLVSEEGIFPAANGRFTLPEIIQNLQTSVQDAAPYTKLCSASVPTANWQGSDPYTQSISCGYDVTSRTIANIQLSDTLYDQLVADGVTYLNIKNSDGRLLIKAKGGKPSVDLTLQITCTETR